MSVRRLPFKLHASAAKAPPVPQNTNKTGCLKVAARRGRPEARAIMKLIAMNRGQLTDPIVDLKSNDRIEEKKRTELRGRAELIGDYLRGTIIFETTRTLYAGVRVALGVVDAVRVRDRLMFPAANLYGDMCVNIRLSDEHIMELQLHVEPMYIVKQLEQILYSRRRVLEARNRPDDREQISALAASSTKMFAIARHAVDAERRLSPSEYKNVVLIFMAAAGVLTPKEQKAFTEVARRFGS